MSGIYVRKVQKIGGQIVVNIPRAIGEHLGIKRGDLVVYTEIEDSVAIILKMNPDKIAAFRRQEAMGFGEGKDGKGIVHGKGGGSPDAGDGNGVGSGGGSSEAEGGDGGQDKLHDQHDDSGDAGAEGRPEKDADSEGGAGTERGDHVAALPKGSKRKLIVEDPMEHHLGRVTKSKHDRD